MCAKTRFPKHFMIADVRVTGQLSLQSSSLIFFVTGMIAVILKQLGSLTE